MSFNVKILDYVPEITEQDIRRGYVPRYFVARGNQITTVVHEVSDTEYNKLKQKDFLVTGYINWSITGKLEDTYIDLYTGNPTYEAGLEPILFAGVLTQNEAAVRFLGRKIPAVINYLRRYDQFYVGE